MVLGERKKLFLGLQKCSQDIYKGLLFAETILLLAFETCISVTNTGSYSIYCMLTWSELYIDIAFAVCSDISFCASSMTAQHCTTSQVRDSVKRNDLRFLSLYSTTSLDVTGEDCLLFYWKREVVHSIKCRGDNNCGTWFC